MYFHFSKREEQRQCGEFENLAYYLKRRLKNMKIKSGYCFASTVQHKKLSPVTQLKWRKHIASDNRRILDWRPNLGYRNMACEDGLFRDYFLLESFVLLWVEYV